MDQENRCEKRECARESPADQIANSSAQRSNTIRLNSTCAWLARPATCASISRRDFSGDHHSARRAADPAPAAAPSSASARRRSQLFIGMLKPSFFRSRIASGSRPLSACFSDVLAPAVADLEVTGHRERQLHDVGVEKRRARLERRRHAHAIDLHQDVVGEIDRQIGVELTVQQSSPPVAASASRTGA